ncbi:hypothetical protein MNBD_GAMMA01-1967 [hydrothermal vent metagenome]|uniref:Uncharacterized protein n=1 Tax=hydrothermal vent metagenome TaxID=652676 RepID=A0A3B0V6R2_9ZZZZ
MKNFNSNQTFSRYDYFLGQALYKLFSLRFPINSLNIYKNVKKFKQIYLKRTENNHNGYMERLCHIMI